MIVLKRIFDEDARQAEFKVLVDRIWPRGIKKTDIKLDRWYRELAPSTALRKWFNHDPDRWMEFKKKYRSELKEKTDTLNEIRQLEKQYKEVTLLYAAREEKRNNAVVLKAVLGSRH